MAWHWDRDEKAWLTSEEKRAKDKSRAWALCIVVGIIVSGASYNWAVQTSQEYGLPEFVGFLLGVIAAVAGFAVGFVAVPVSMVGCCVIGAIGAFLFLFTASWDKEPENSIPNNQREEIVEFDRIVDAAESGEPTAQARLGWHYYTGKDVRQDYERAHSWFSKAAESKNADAQYYLGIMNLLGEGVDENAEEAVTWFRKSAEQGHSNAQFMMGEAFEKGYGLDQDLDLAIEWYEKSAENGNEDAQDSLKRLEAE